MDTFTFLYSIVTVYLIYHISFNELSYISKMIGYRDNFYDKKIHIYDYLEIKNKFIHSDYSDIFDKSFSIYNLLLITGFSIFVLKINHLSIFILICTIFYTTAFIYYNLFFTKSIESINKDINYKDYIKFDFHQINSTEKHLITIKDNYSDFINNELSTFTKKSYKSYLALIANLKNKQELSLHDIEPVSEIEFSSLIHFINTELFFKQNDELCSAIIFDNEMTINKHIYLKENSIAKFINSDYEITDFKLNGYYFYIFILMFILTLEKISLITPP